MMKRVFIFNFIMLFSRKYTFYVFPKFHVASDHKCTVLLIIFER